MLKTTPFGESDLCVELYTAQVGRARVMARGALKSSKRYMGTLELGALLKVDYRPKLHSLPTLGPCDIVSSPWKARAELPRLATLCYLLELISRSTAPDDPDEGLFRSLVELLQLLEGAEGLTQLELLSWELALLERIGYQLRIDRCPYTGLAPNALSAREGGTLHTSAQRPCEPVPTSALRTLYRLQRRSSVDRELSLNPEELSALRRAFATLWAELCGAPLKSYGFLSQVLALHDSSPSAPSALPGPPQVTMSSTMKLMSSALILLLTLSLLSGCAQAPKSAQGTLRADDELIVEELEEVALQEGLAESQKTELKRSLERSVELSKRVTLGELSSTALNPLPLPFSAAQLSPYLEGLKRDMSQNFAQGARAVGLSFSSRRGALRCALAPSAWAQELLESLQREAGQLTITSAQPGLWLGHKLSPLDSSRTALLPPAPLRPLSTRGGDWLAVSGQEVIEALILEGPSPWLPTSSHLIGRCEPNAALRALTRADVKGSQEGSAHAQLTLTHLGWLSLDDLSSP